MEMERFLKDLDLRLYGRNLIPYTKNTSLVPYNNNQYNFVLYPKKERIYYISVKNREVNEKYYNMWLNAWWNQHLKDINYSINCNKNADQNFVIIESIPEPQAQLKPVNFVLINSLIVRKKNDLERIRIFNFDLNIFTYFNNLNHSWYLNYLILVLNQVRRELQNVNLKKGFIESRNLFDCKYYPFISEIALRNFKAIELGKLNGYNFVIVYKWIVQIIILQMVNLNIKALKVLNNLNVKAENFVFLDLYTQFKINYNWCFNMLDNSIKQFYKKDMILINTEIHAGYDTEYLGIDINKNKLLSAQLSTAGLVKVFLPIKKDFIFEGVNTLTSETYIKKGPKIKFEKDLLSWINKLINESRINLYGKYDSKILKAVDKLNKDPNIKYIKRTNEGIIFQYKLDYIINKFIKPAENEDLKISFDSLIYLASKDHSFENIVSRILNKLYFEDELTCLLGDLNNLDRAGKSIDGLTLDGINKPINEIILSNKDNILYKERCAENYFNKEKEQIFNVGNIFKIKVTESIYLYSHFNSADLSMLNDWDQICNNNIDILKKSFTSLIKPIETESFSVFIRDTVLLASAVAGSLDKLGAMHRVYKKDIDKKWYNKMDVFYQERYEEFKEYAMRDSLITLIHGLFMNDFAFKLGNMKVPNTLGALATKYLRNKWYADKYKGYEIDPNYPLGDVQSSITPRGVTGLDKAGEVLGSYIGSFRGGRNECYAYGVDSGNRWFDYDLTSCYSTVMSMLGSPDYTSGFMNQKSPEKMQDIYNASRLKKENSFENKHSFINLYLKEQEQEQALDIPALLGSPNYSNIVSLSEKSDLTQIDFMNGYSALRVKFKFPESIKYPPLPVNLDKNITIYPLSGESLITGLEYLSAFNILKQALLELDKYLENSEKRLLRKEFYIHIIHGSYIPFTKGYKPFYNVINELQANRRMHPKKSANERIYKDLGNMLYGKLVSGINNNRKYDARTRLMKALLGNDITNPIIGTWITGFVRSLLAELLYNVNILGGFVTAVTTDGFVCNIDNLEEKILANCKNIKFLLKYREIRNLLSKDPRALEVKTNVLGIMQWTTRGQLSLDHTNPSLNNYEVPIAAMTGFQKFYFKQKELIDLVQLALENGNKLLFLQKRLTGALDIYKDQKHKNISLTSAERIFRTVFDTKRVICNKISVNMYDTVPYYDKEEAIVDRMLINELRDNKYSHDYSRSLIYASKTFKDEMLKYLIRITVKEFNFTMDTWFKEEFINLLKNIFNIENSARLMLLINNAINDRLTQISYLIPNNKNIEWFDKLYLYCRTNDLLHPIFKSNSYIKSLEKHFKLFNIPVLDLIIYQSPEEKLAVWERVIIINQAKNKLNYILNNINSYETNDLKNFINYPVQIISPIPETLPLPLPLLDPLPVYDTSTSLILFKPMLLKNYIDNIELVELEWPISEELPISETDFW